MAVEYAAANLSGIAEITVRRWVEITDVVVDVSESPYSLYAYAWRELGAF